MNHYARHLAVVLTMALALTLAGCGDPQATPGASSNAANITFRTDPVDVQVWIDGKNAGTTPVVIAVDAGKHDIEFKRDGFESVKDSLSVEAGKDLTVKTALAVTGDESSRFKTLLAAIGIAEHENLEGKTHRGAMKHGVMLYWPQRKVRREGMSTWRVEFSDDYDDDATLEFRKGKNVLFSAPLVATGGVMEGALPPAVMEELKRGSSITWGAYFPDRKKKNVTASFKVDSGASLAKKLSKIERRSVYRRAGALERELIKIELKRNYRFYTEALTDAMSVLNTWPKTQLADKVIVDSLQRLKLKDSMLYVEIMKRVAGKGGHARKGSASGGVGDVSAPLPPSLVAPKLPAPTDAAASSAGGTKAGGLKAGGIGVTPTGGDQKRDAGPIQTPGGSSGNAGDDPAAVRAKDDEARRLQLRGLQDKLKAAEAAASAEAEAEQRMTAAGQALEAAKQDALKAQEDVEAAKRDLAAAEEANDGPAAQAAQAALDAANAAAAQAQAQVETTQRGRDDMARESREALERAGSEGGSKEEAERLKREIERIQTESQQDPNRPVDPNAPVDPADVRRLDDPLNPTPEHTPEEELANRLENAQGGYDSAVARFQEITARVETKQAALDAANTAYEAASTALDAAEQGGNAAAIAAAETALGLAHEDRSRAAMESERAQGDLERTRQEVSQAQDALTKAQEDPAPAPELKR